MNSDFFPYFWIFCPNVTMDRSAARVAVRLESLDCFWRSSAAAAVRLGDSAVMAENKHSWHYVVSRVA